MKKSLLAVAAIGAFASAAQAQSSVTVYGIVDAGYIGSNAREGSVSSAATGTQTNKIQKSAFGQGAESTSRLGFRGTEDLGGGTSAFFTVELGLTPQNSELSGGGAEDRVQRTTNASGSAVDNRQSFVGVKKNGIGQFAFGRQYTPIFNTAIATDPGAFNNIVGNVIYTSGSVYGSAATPSGGANNSIGFTNRASNSFTVQSDRFAGFRASGMYALNNQNQTQTTASGATAADGGGNTNWGGWGLSGDFTWQKLVIGAAYQSFKTQYNTGVYGALGTGNASNLVNLNSVGATAGQSIPAANIFPAAQISDKQTYVGATYDFGILKAYAQWVGRKVQNDYTTAVASSSNTSATYAFGAGEQLNRNAQQIGVRSYITPTIESWASIGSGKVKAQAASGQPSANFTAFQLGSNYYLSKRTNLYAIYGQSQTSSSSYTGRVGSGANQYALGVRHTF